MDTKTLEALLKEATKNHAKSKKLFDKYDNSEDMHAMETWATVVGWLTAKLPIKL